ncbi:GTP-binding protein [Hydrogenivirga sp. 128-5-R1-1]|uniref:CobW family GTP-binding protein n=1 Tax=Hydrogenivirga sp. 128-5-R1-1 TaxID=392423 RepID=UPI00015F3825|nr:GTP-binding protein [Hydrogenivirga sp. 128-5-R1-1]EDP76545.1 cobalamin synthesis related protein CobW [Hydrogenivirga sp. 128-5-R1-1]
MISSYVVTGYLGSGKTTLIINSFREHLKDKKVAVVVNEFGEVGLDGKILKNAYSEVLEIEEGCICCKLSQEFESSVLKIIRDYSPEVIVVESSGTSEPFPIMFSLRTVGTAVEGVICVVDSKNFFKYKDEDTAKYQLASSNVVVLNKIDLVDEDTLRKVEEEVKDIKENYRLENMFSNEDKKNIYAIYRAVRGVVPPEVFAGTGNPIELKKNVHLHTHEDMGQRVVEFERELSYEELMEFLSKLPNNVYRAKGIVKLKDYPYPVFVHYVFGDVDMGMPAQGYEGRSFIVLIGKGLQDIISL